MTKIEWPRLIAETQTELDRGTDPSDPKVRALAQRWMRLIDEKTAGDAELAKGYGKIIDMADGERNRQSIKEVTWGLATQSPNPSPLLSSAECAQISRVIRFGAYGTGTGWRPRLA